MSEQTPSQDSASEAQSQAYQEVIANLEAMGISVSASPPPMSEMEADMQTIEEMYEIPQDELQESVDQWNETLGIANDVTPEYYSDLVWEAEKKKARARAEGRTTFKMKDPEEFFKERGS